MIVKTLLLAVILIMGTCHDGPRKKSKERLHPEKEVTMETDNELNQLNRDSVDISQNLLERVIKQTDDTAVGILLDDKGLNSEFLKEKLIEYKLELVVVEPGIQIIH